MVSSILAAFVGGTIGMVIADLLVTYAKNRTPSPRRARLDAKLQSSWFYLPSLILVSLLAVAIATYAVLPKSQGGASDSSLAVLGLLAGYLAGARLSKHTTAWTLQRSTPVVSVAVGGSAILFAVNLVVAVVLLVAAVL
jgi:hypothetical protein